MINLFQGGADKELLDMLKADFEKVRHVKPKASRSDSSETYIVATGFKGRKAIDAADQAAAQDDNAAE